MNSNQGLRVETRYVWHLPSPRRHLEGPLRAVQPVMGPGVSALRHQVLKAGGEALHQVK